jgi:osmotically-inducible protein OsmY
MFRKIFALFVVIVCMCSCVETVVVGTVAGSAIVVNKNINDRANPDKISEQKDKDAKTIVDDSLSEIEVKEIYKHVDVMVFGGRIVLTGYVVDGVEYKKKAEDRIKALRPNNEVINEILILGPHQSVSSFNDYLVSKKILVMLNKLDGIKFKDYKYNVTNSIVVVIGKSNSKNQMNEVTDTISRTSGVKKVISYIQY